jgi:hypothetical protein
MLPCRSHPRRRRLSGDRANPEQLGPGYDLGEGDVPGVVAFSDVDAVADGAGQGCGPMARPWWRHDGWVPEVDDDQLAALRRLRAAFGFVEVVEVVGHDQVVSNDPEDDRLEGAQGSLAEGARMADPRRMTPQEHGEAHALLVRAITDPDWQAASQALDNLMGKLLVVRQLLEVEQRLPKREPRRNG